ncbi:MAG: hypothetical protein ABI707_18740 [Ferruginibacter sp.]
MKKNTHLVVLLFFALLIDSCTKTTTPALTATPGVAAVCIPKTESTTLAGNSATYEYLYNSDGKITTIKKFIGGFYHVLEDSTVIGDNSMVSYGGLNNPPGDSYTIVFNGSIFDGMPSQAQTALTEKGITRTDVNTYFFFYDYKNRLFKVGEQTDLVIGDWEYDLSIFYNDQDNVTALSYEWTTGPRTVTTETASGYDDKPTPFAGIKKWYFLMHAAWNNYDPEPLFTALSKNNPLGYTSNDWKRTMTYTYNDNGFPVKRMNTNTNSSGTYTFEETYDYQCR